MNNMNTVFTLYNSINVKGTQTFWSLSQLMSESIVPCCGGIWNNPHSDIEAFSFNKSSR